MRNSVPSNQFDVLSSVRTELLSHGIDFSVKELISKCREESLVFKRALVCYCLHLSGYSTLDIGAIINRDHSTVIWSLNYNPKKYYLRKRYTDITSKIKPIHAIDNLIVLEKIKFHQSQIESLTKLLK